MQKEPNKLVVRIILGIVAVLLVVGMVYSFTPALNANTNSEGTVVLKVNDQDLTDVELERVRSSNQVFSFTRDGIIGDDLQTIVTAVAIQQTVLKQDSQQVRVSNGDVNEEVQKIRTQNGLEKNKDWSEALQRVGRTDSSFRREIRDQLRVQKRADELKKEATISDAEAKLYYDLNPKDFKSEATVVAQQIQLKDAKKADEVLKAVQVKGSDFGKIAEQNGAKDGGKILAGKPAGKLAFPTAVADAVFALNAGDISDVIAADKKYYIVKVTKVNPESIRPFAEVKASALKKATDLKANAIVSDWIEGLVDSAQVKAVDPKWTYNNPVIAKVGSAEIRYHELLIPLYTNPQVASVLQQGEQAEGFINQFFKPQVLDGLVNQRVAELASKKIKQPFFGSRPDIVNQVQAYAARDVKITEGDIEKYYKQNIANYTIKGSADVTEAIFDDRKTALDFRAAFSNGASDFNLTASQFRGTASEFGPVQEGDSKLSPLLEAAVFKSGRLSPINDGSVSDVLERDGKFAILFVQDLVRARVKPLSEVRSEASEQLLSEKQTQAGQAFLTKERDGIKIQNLLKKALETQQARIDAAATKAPQAPGSLPSGATTTPTPKATPKATPSDSKPSSAATE